MTEQELREKIIETLEKGGRNFLKSKETKVSIYEYYADALIAAEIGDVSSEKAMRELAEAFHREKCAEYDLINYKLQKAEHRAEVAERALRNAAPRLNCRGGIGKGFCKVDECEYYHCNNDEGCIKAHLEQAEKELAEERKDD